MILNKDFKKKHKKKTKYCSVHIILYESLKVTDVSDYNKITGATTTQLMYN